MSRTFCCVDVNMCSMAI